MNNTNLLLHKIEYLRKELIDTGMKFGLTSSKTLYISQKLDQLINARLGIHH